MITELSLFRAIGNVAQRNHLTYLMNAERKVFCTDFIMENASDQGKLFRAVKKSQ